VIDTREAKPLRKSSSRSSSGGSRRLFQRDIELLPMQEKFRLAKEKIQSQEAFSQVQRQKIEQQEALIQEQQQKIEQQEATTKVRNDYVSLYNSHM
jgi:hypothetical protein